MNTFTILSVILLSTLVFAPVANAQNAVPGLVETNEYIGGPSGAAGGNQNGAPVNMNQALGGYGGSFQTPQFGYPPPQNQQAPAPQTLSGTPSNAPPGAVPGQGHGNYRQGNRSGLANGAFTGLGRLTSSLGMLGGMAGMMGRGGGGSGNNNGNGGGNGQNMNRFSQSNQSPYGAQNNPYGAPMSEETAESYRQAWWARHGRQAPTPGQ